MLDYYLFLLIIKEIIEEIRGFIIIQEVPYAGRSRLQVRRDTFRIIVTQECSMQTTVRMIG